MDNFTAVQTLTDNLNKLSSGDRAFAESLLSAFNTARGPSDKQMFWIHKLAIRATGQAERKEEVGDLSGVTSLFAKAKRHLKHPAIVLYHDGQLYRMNEAGERAKVPGSINVATAAAYGENTWYGRITRDGQFDVKRELPAGLLDLIREFAREPAKVAARHGKLTGRCCFCNRKLEDERSTQVGYGPVCARHYDLPWGEEKLDLEAMVA